MELKGKVSIVTGGSRGIGRGISEVLVESGSNLAVIYRANRDEFEKFRSSLSHRSGVEIEGYQLDVANNDRVIRTFKEIFNRFGSIDVLVNCAGRASSTRSVDKVSVKEWQETINLDLNAAFYCSKAVLEYMHRRRGGHIINISSIVATTCHAGSSSYAAAKAGLEAFTKVLAREEASKGIRVNAIAPGLITSDMSAQMSKVYGEQRMKEVMESIPLGKFGEPSDIGHMVAYLVSPKGAYITGQVLGIDGGMYYWKSTFADI
jgi:3-oxoacyl-[acyl-carrier protein] reductase